MKRILILSCIVFLFTAVTSSWVYAQEEEKPAENADEKQEEVSDGDKAEEAAKNLANPNASIGFLTFPTDVSFYRGDLPDANSQSAFKFNFQPSLPYKIGESMNLFVRPLIPIIINQPKYSDENGFEDLGPALGDISVDVALGKSFKGGYVAMIGGFVSMPTAGAGLGTNRWLVGPELVLGKVGGWGSAYVLLFQSFSASGNEDGNISVTGGQYFYTINLKKAWQIQGQPVFSYNGDAAEGSRWTFPLGSGISKTTMFGNLPIKFGVQYWYYVASPENFGKAHQIRFLITPVIPLPW